MNGIMGLAYITFKEGIKNRAIFGIFIMALLMLSAVVTLTGLFMRDIVKVAADLSLATISFSGLLMTLFIGANLLAKDIDKRTIYMVISRPVSRSQYTIGKFFGLFLLVLAAVAFLGLLSALPVYFAGQGDPNPQSIFKWSVYAVAILFIALKLVLLASIIIFFSSITSTSFITLVLTIATYLIGSTNEIVKGILDAKMEGVHISAPLAVVIKFVYYVFPNLSAFDFKIQAAHGLPVPLGYLFWIFSYWLLYTSIMIAGAALIMRRREFP
jgi:ABC-type transport system involved in multi-copper enzyme maturation permease subunit